MDAINICFDAFRGLRTFCLALLLAGCCLLSPSFGQFGGGGMGGPGAGGIRGGGQFGGGMPSGPAAPVVSFETPQQTPAWLAASVDRNDKIAKQRLALRKTISSEFKSIELKNVIKTISESCGTKFFIVVSELDLLGIDVDTPITINLPEASVETTLNLILEPLELTYKFTEACVLITSKDAAESEPSLRYYDMGWVVDDSSMVDSLLNCIQQTIAPDTWLQNGGVNTILPVNNVLVVSAPDSVHLKIEGLLANLAKFKAQRPPEKNANTKKSIVPTRKPVLKSKPAVAPNRK
ncbi:MAG: hypothetical protein AAF483_20520 [Planctomycetota bacterium]